jgi:hypothetical protein
MMPTMPVLRAASRLGARRSNATAAFAAPLASTPMALRDHIVCCSLLVMLSNDVKAMRFQYFARSSAQGPGRNGTVQAGDADKKGDDTLTLDMAIPRAMGGRRRGQTPERLFSMAYSCALLSAPPRPSNELTTVPHSVLPWRTPARVREGGTARSCQAGACAHVRLPRAAERQ